MRKALYTLFIFEGGTRFYFKGKRLHREAGPAIVPYNAIEEYINLNSVDENLYEKVFIKEVDDKQIVLKFSNGLEKKMDSPFCHSYCINFYLNGKHSKEEDFKEDLKNYQILKFKSELNADLKINKPTTKRLKI
jgi:hypothetical protein